MSDGDLKSWNQATGVAPIALSAASPIPRRQEWMTLVIFLVKSQRIMDRNDRRLVVEPQNVLVKLDHFNHFPNMLEN